MAETWSKLTPLDSANASEGPARIRFIKTLMAAALAVEHTFNTTTLTLTHNLPYQATEPTAGNANRWFYDTTTKQFKRDTGAAWEAITPPKGFFPAGCKTAFCQAAAPTGWTKDTTYNDKMLRVVSGSGGSTGGAAAFTMSAASHNHTLSDYTYDHTSHTTGTHFSNNFSMSGTSYLNATIHGAGGGTHGHTTTEAYSHTHISDGTFRPQYVDVIICTKDA